MREIKFRAWDREDKEFWKYDFSITKDGWMFWINSDASMCGHYETPTYEPYYPSIDRFIPMQYTGLKDKNGVEIYEGDIVRGKEFWDKNMCVVYEEGLCSFELRDNPTKDYGCSEHLYDTSSNDDLGYQFWEVIGNIYENPRLMEEK